MGTVLSIHTSVASLQVALFKTAEQADAAHHSETVLSAPLWTTIIWTSSRARWNSGSENSAPSVVCAQSRRVLLKEQNHLHQCCRTQDRLRGKQQLPVSGASSCQQKQQSCQELPRCACLHASKPAACGSFLKVLADWARQRSARIQTVTSPGGPVPAMQTKDCAASVVPKSKLWSHNPGRRGLKIDPCWSHGKLSGDRAEMHTSTISSRALAAPMAARMLDRIVTQSLSSQSCRIRRITYTSPSFALGKVSARNHNRRMPSV